MLRLHRGEAGARRVQFGAQRRALLCEFGPVGLVGVLVQLCSVAKTRVEGWAAAEE